MQQWENVSSIFPALISVAMKYLYNMEDSQIMCSCYTIYFKVNCHPGLGGFFVFHYFNKIF